MGSHEEELCAALTRIALAGDGVVLGLGMALVAIRTWLRFYSHSRALKKLEDTPASRISDLRSLVVEDTQVNSGLERSPSKRGELLVIIRGKVDTKAAVDSQWRRKDNELLTSHSAGEKAVIVERTQTCLYNEWRGLFGWSSDWRGLLGWGSLKEQVTVSMRKVPFVLVEGNGFQNYAFAHIDMDESKHPLPLVTVYHQLHPVQASPYTFLQAIFGRGYPVGLLDEEKILPPGKEITAVGTLGVAPDGQPMIKSSKHLPCFLTEFTRDQLVTEIAAGTNVLFWTGIVFSTFAMGVLGYAFFNLMTAGIGENGKSGSCREKGNKSAPDKTVFLLRELMRIPLMCQMENCVLFVYLEEGEQHFFLVGILSAVCAVPKGWNKTSMPGVLCADKVSPVQYEFMMPEPFPLHAFAFPGLFTELHCSKAIMKLSAAFSCTMNVFF